MNVTAIDSLTDTEYTEELQECLDNWTQVTWGERFEYIPIAVLTKGGN